MDDIPRALPLVRDTVFRRLLALADLTAAAAALAILGAATDGRMNPAGLATLPLIVLLAKMTGRYDHVDVVLRKSTLDEIPKRLTLAAAWSLGCALISDAAGEAIGPSSADVGLLWAATASLLILGRTCARAAAGLAAPPERVLIVGSSRARVRLAHSLASDPGARIELVGFLPLEDERRVISDWGTRSRRRRHLRFDDIAAVVRELDVRSSSTCSVGT